MLVIRLFRTGKKHQPFFKIVVTDKRRPPKGGRFVEEIGFVNPLTKEKKINKERAKYWLSVGAQPSDTVYNLLVSEKFVEGKKIPLHKKKKVKKGAETKEAIPKTVEGAKSEGPVEVKPEEKKEESGGKTEEVKSEEKPEKEKEEPKKEPGEEKPKEEPKAEELKTEEKPEVKPEEKKEEPKKESKEERPEEKLKEEAKPAEK